MPASHLSDQQITQLRAKLGNMLRDAQSQLAPSHASLADGSEVASQEDAQAEQRSAARAWDAVRHQYSAKELARIQEELARLDAGSYGLCAACACEIPFARLQIEPQTQHCVACKSAWEKQAGIAP
ncbi:MAG: TraR/DksA family transcriptional regulator [Brachymonas sp.]|jgi:DnaK suppressor protein